MQDKQRFGCYLQRKDGKIKKSRQSFLLKIPQISDTLIVTTQEGIVNA
jgi:hypothetical protein